MLRDPIVDLRSDTVTRPVPGMLEAMTSAPLGDDVFGDDPTVRQLEETAAELLGKEKALFVPSGTMANSIAIAVATDPGDEMIIDSAAHSLNFEVAGASRLWGVQVHPLASDAGMVPLAAIEGAVRPDDIHTPRSRLVVLEQTNNLSGGLVLPLEYLAEVSAFCRKSGLHFHLDGARLFNASVAAGVPPKAYGDCVDSLMFCISKGLGAPAGSILLGTTKFIDAGRRVRKLLGGGLRQGGLLAACGLYALKNNVTRLADDHAHAQTLATAIRAAKIPGVEVKPADTNMVYVSVEPRAPARIAQFVQALKDEGVLAVNILGNAVRFVFHMDVPEDAMARICETAIRVFRSGAQRTTTSTP